MNTPHPDLETLAELADAETATTAVTAAPAELDHDNAAVLEHVAGCEACTADLEALRHVRATLRALPPVPMPADVAQRLDAALRSANIAAPNVTALQKRSKQRGTTHEPWWRTMPYGAAASVVVIIALVVAGVVGLQHAGTGSKKTASTPAATASAAAGTGAATIESGTNYTADQLRAQVAAVVNTNVPGAAAQYPGLTRFGADAANASSAAAAAAPAESSAPAPLGAASASASASAAPSSAPVFAAPAAGSTGAPRQNLAPITAPGGPLADPAALAACIQTLAGKPEQPVLVDFATFNGAPSTIIVLPDPDIAQRLDIYVEADTANCANENFTYAAFLPASGG